MELLVEQLHPLVLNVGLAIHNADWNWKNVSSPFMRIYYVTEGTAQVVLPTITVQLFPGNLYFIPAFTEHSYICHAHFCHYYVHLYEETGLNERLLDEWEFPVEIPAEEMDLMLIRRLCEINPYISLPQSDPAIYDNKFTLQRSLLRNRQCNFCDKVESRGIVLQLLARFLKQAGPRPHCKDNRIRIAIGYIRKHICESIKIEQLAVQACLSKDHFIRLFHAETGETPLQYITRQKMEKAQLLLLTDNMPVKEVALTLAFEDYSYFNRLFKKVTGVTPQSYRNLHSSCFYSSHSELCDE